MLGEITGLGDLSHASVVFSRDGRYAYVFGRDGGLTQVDLLRERIVHRVMQAGNSPPREQILAAPRRPSGLTFIKIDRLLLSVSLEPAVFPNKVFHRFRHL